MEKKELEWGLVAVIGILLLILGYYVFHQGVVMFIGILLMVISLLFGYRDRRKVLT